MPPSKRTKNKCLPEGKYCFGCGGLLDERRPIRDALLEILSNNLKKGMPGLTGENLKFFAELMGEPENLPYFARLAFYRGSRALLETALPYFERGEIPSRNDLKDG